MNMNTRCPICQTDTMVVAVGLGCGHAMCRTCMLQYTVDRGGTSCPLCRHDICGCCVAAALRHRPFTRGRGKRVRADYLLWKGRSIVHMMKQPQSFRNLAYLIHQLNEIANEDEGAQKAIAAEFEKLYFNPIAFRALVELRGSSLFEYVQMFRPE